jgi:hypothetical protein
MMAMDGLSHPSVEKVHLADRLLTGLFFDFINKKWHLTWQPFEIMRNVRKGRANIKRGVIIALN